MTDWNNSKLRLLGELVGSGTVLLGLVIVGVELRQNTAAIQSAAWSDQKQGLTDEFVAIVEDCWSGETNAKGR